MMLQTSPAYHERVSNVDLKYTPQVRARFWSKVTKTDTCWIWNGARSGSGYGKVRINYKAYRVHRIAWEMEHGPIPKGMDVLHRCDTPLCCNPYTCLFLGTHQDNMTDRNNKCRTALGERNGQSKLTQPQVDYIRTSNDTNVSISSQFGISISHVSNIRRHKFW